MLLEMAGYGVSTFMSGEEMLASNDLGGLACLLIDVHLPGMSGFEVQDALGAAGRAIPIVFMSGRANAATRVNAVRRAAYIDKPFSGVSLIAEIQRAIESHRGR